MQPGDRVLARIHDPVGHCRLPSYVQGRPGTVVAVRGRFRLPDDLAHGRDGELHTLLNVRFAAVDLWPEPGPHHDVHLDLYDVYLTPLTGGIPE